MSLDLTGLAGYVKENEALLVTQAVFASKTAGLIEAKGNVQVGIKSSETINRLITDAVLQSGASCGFTPDGETSISQRSLSVGKIKIQEAFCTKDFEAKYTQKALREGSYYDYLAFANDITAAKAAKIGAAIETALWRGAITTPAAYQVASQFDGIIEQCIASSVPAVTPLNGDASFDVANVIANIDALYSGIAPAILDKDDVVIFVSSKTFRNYVIALKNANLFHYAADTTSMELMIPATNIKLIGVNGLNTPTETSEFAVAISMSNLFLGTDMLNEQDKYELFYAKEADEMRFNCQFKLAVNFAFAEEVAMMSFAY